MRSLLCALLALLVGASCVVTPKPKPFEIVVLPQEEPVAVRAAIAGERSLFLIHAPGQGASDGAIELRATVTGASYDFYDGFVAGGGTGARLLPGRVVELAVIPEALDEGVEESLVTVTVTGTRGGLTASASRTLPVVVGEDTRGEDAARVRDLFVPWLAREHPELGVDAATAWEGTISGAHLLVVSHYLFYNETWELGVSWHVMIAPYDWATLYLRRRFVESAPSFGARIESVSGGTAPAKTAPPPAVTR
jgi:hypothetical protein